MKKLITILTLAAALLGAYKAKAQTNYYLAYGGADIEAPGMPGNPFPADVTTTNGHDFLIVATNVNQGLVLSNIVFYFFNVVDDSSGDGGLLYTNIYNYEFPSGQVPSTNEPPPIVRSYPDPTSLAPGFCSVKLTAYLPCPGTNSAKCFMCFTPPVGAAVENESFWGSFKNGVGDVFQPSSAGTACYATTPQETFFLYSSPSSYPVTISISYPDYTQTADGDGLWCVQAEFFGTACGGGKFSISTTLTAPQGKVGGEWTIYPYFTNAVPCEGGWAGDGPKLDVYTNVLYNPVSSIPCTWTYLPTDTQGPVYVGEPILLQPPGYWGLESDTYEKLAKMCEELRLREIWRPGDPTKVTENPYKPAPPPLAFPQAMLFGGGFTNDISVMAQSVQTPTNSGPYKILFNTNPTASLTNSSWQIMTNILAENANRTWVYTNQFWTDETGRNFVGWPASNSVSACFYALKFAGTNWPR